MNFKVILIIMSLFGFLNLAQAETRCGWVDGVEGAHQWLTDKDGNWTFYESDFMTGQDKVASTGIELVQPWDRGQTIDVMPFYYYCGCMDVVSDKASMTIKEIKSFKQKPLEACLSDQSIDPKLRVDERIPRNDMCYRDYVLNAGDCNAAFPVPGEEFRQCLIGPTNHARRCCKSGTNYCAEFLPN